MMQVWHVTQVVLPKTFILNLIKQVKIRGYSIRQLAWTIQIYQCLKRQKRGVGKGEGCSGLKETKSTNKRQDVTLDWIQYGGGGFRELLGQLNKFEYKVYIG